MVQFLLDRGAAVNVRTDSTTCDVGRCWSTPLIAAIDRPEWYPRISQWDSAAVARHEAIQDSVLVLLLARGADLRLAATMGETPLHRAAHTGSCRYRGPHCALVYDMADPGGLRSRRALHPADVLDRGTAHVRAAE